MAENTRSDKHQDSQKNKGNQSSDSNQNKRSDSESNSERKTSDGSGGKGSTGHQSGRDQQKGGGPNRDKDQAM